MMTAATMLALILALSIAAADAAVRIKDIADIKGVRENQIVGYGLVIGLNGTGDTLRNAPFTEQSLQSMLDNMGINIRRNVASNAKRRGRHGNRGFAALYRRRLMDRVAISSLGDASSLLGGTLVMTQLRGADGEVYAVAQGAITVAGYCDRRRRRRPSTKVSPTSGRIPNGALIEREVRATSSIWNSWFWS